MSEELTQFLETIYGDQEGFAYVARKAASKIQAKGDWNQDWYRWPEDKERMVKKILDQSGRYEVYYGPAIYRTKNAVRTSFLSSRVCWIDWDGNAPHPDTFDYRPSIRVQSSLPGHEHWYFLLSENCSDLERLEEINANLAYNYGADLSGWDATQVLRPVGTTNHKRQAGVTLLHSEGTRFSLTAFEFSNLAPARIEPIAPSDIPSHEDVLNKFNLDGETFLLYKNGEDDRSKGLMKLGYLLCEKGLNNEEALSLLLDADERWGKFSGRLDQLSRLSQIVSIAREKHPLQEQEEYKRLKPYGFLDLINAPEIELSWVWEGLLAENGYMLIAGPSSIGKSQLSIDFACKAVLGLDFLDRPCRKDLKIGFLSLEMDGPELQYFTGLMANGYTDEQKAELNERFVLIPVGEPYYLNKEKERNDLEEMIHELQLDGIIMDSLTSMVSGELTSEGNVKPVMDWNDKIRKRHSCFTWIVHHNRKGNGDNKKPSKLDDVFGSYLIPRNATTEFTLVQGMGDSIQCVPNKVRLSKKPEPFLIFRDSNLHFTTKKSGLVIKKKGKEIDVPELTVKVDDDEAYSKFDY